MALDVNTWIHFLLHLSYGSALDLQFVDLHLG